MTKIKILILLLLSTYLSFGQSKNMYIKFKVTNKSEINTITKIISIDNYEDEILYGYADIQELAKIYALGYSPEIILPDLNSPKETCVTTKEAMWANWDKYPTYSLYVEMMNYYATTYPNLCQLIEIGTTVENRKLLALKISDNVSTEEAEPEFFYTSTMHGDETTGYILLLRLIDYLLTNYGTNTRVTNIVNNMVVVINPNANPDGTYASSETQISSSYSTRENANGVDINRNFKSYNGGDHPDGEAWQPETIAMMDFAEQTHFVMSANFHGGIELANYPWDEWHSDDNPHPDTDWWSTLSTNYATSCHTYGPSGYFTGQNNGVTQGADWYLVYGGRQDFMNIFHHCREFTLEISDEKTVSSSLLDEHWNYNYLAMLDYIEEANYGFNGTVKDAVTGEPLDAKIEIIGHDKDNSWVVTDPTNGDYYRPIAPGTYSVTYSAYGYSSKTETVTVTGYKTTTIKNVVLGELPNTSVSGTVTDASSGNFLNNVTIEILDSPISSVLTLSNGTYSISGVYYGTYQFKASKDGYASAIKTVTIDGSNSTVNFALSVSTAINFETGIPTGWIFGGNADWTRVATGAYSGTYCMKSGVIDHSQTSTMQVIKTGQAGEISFYKKVSSETGYDFLKFYIDGVEKGSWSGIDANWNEVSYTVTAGSHTYKWIYSKDGGATGGSDCAWVDYVTLPPDVETPTYSVTFNVSYNSSAVNGASVRLSGYGSQNTNSSGVAVFNGVNAVASPGIQYTVSLAGYTTVQSSVIVDGNEIVNVNLELVQNSYEITFVVKDNLNQIIEGAEVQLAGYSSVITNSSGEAIFNDVSETQIPGLEYTVSFDEYFDETDFVIVDQEKTVNVLLTPLSANISDINFDVNIYPNPSTGIFFIENNFNLVDWKYQVINQLGQIMLQDENLGNSVITIDLSAYSKGLYFVKIISDKTNKVKTIVVY